jgi:hypothetical protein
MKMLALERLRQLNDRAHDGEPRVNNAHGDRCEKNCLYRLRTSGSGAGGGEPDCRQPSPSGLDG